VWVNGQRVNQAYVDEDFAAAEKARLGIVKKPARPDPRLSRSRAPAPPAPPVVPTHLDTVLSILHTIQPEHIAEITYHDCFDMSVGKNHSDLAMFIALKPGIGFENGRGSFVIGEKPRPATIINVADMPRYRFRILGVFDPETGDALPDVDVIDSASGTQAKTSATGTVSLFFVPEGESTIVLRKAGYRDTTVGVRISPADTMPLTFVLSRIHAPARPDPRPQLSQRPALTPPWESEFRRPTPCRSPSS
jgi:hypothetical protein